MGQIRTRRSGVASALTVATVLWALAGCSSSSSGPVEPQQAPACGRLLVVGVHGSGESNSALLAMGTTVYPVYQTLHAANPGLVAGYGFAYGPQRPDTAAITTAGSSLARFLDVRARDCADEQIVLVGYSDGAQIVGDALQSPTLTGVALARLAAAAMFADPQFNPVDTRTAQGTYDPRYSGEPPRPAYASTIAERVRSYCRAHDVVCQRQDQSADKNSHGGYVTEQTCPATKFIATSIGLTVPAC